jgi:hypothetical protein
MSPLRAYFVSNVCSSLLHLDNKSSFSTLYIVLVGAVTLRAFSNVWSIKVLWGVDCCLRPPLGGWRGRSLLGVVDCCLRPPLGGWRGRSLLGVENWKWMSASQWRLLQCGYHLHTLIIIPPPFRH